MNLLGNIFIVLILLMSVLFMGFAVAVYATHQNWYEVVKGGAPNRPGLEKELAQTKAQRDEAETAKAEAQKQFATELGAKQQEVAKLTTENDALRREHDELVNAHAVLVTQARDATAAMQTTQNTLAAMRDELKTLRDDIRTAQTDRDDQFTKYIKLTDDFNQAQGELKRLTDQSFVLSEQIEKYRRVANKMNVNLNTDPSNIPVDARGVVLATGKDGLIEISLGSDDGMKRGNNLLVYRGSRYLGKIEVYEAYPDKSVAKVLPQFRKGPIEKNDYVKSGSY